MTTLDGLSHRPMLGWVSVLRSAAWYAAAVLVTVLLTYGMIRDPAPATAVLVVLIAAAVIVLGQPRSTGLLLVLYLAPMLALGKVWASVGFSPLYLPDLLAVFAALLALPTALRQMRTNLALRRYALLAVVLGLLVAQGVARGHSAGYPASLKYSVMGVYPVLAVAFAGWLDAHQGGLRRVPLMLAVVPFGLAFVKVVHLADVPSAFGLYVAVAAAFAVLPETPHRRMLGWSSVVGFVLLVAISTRRGVLVTVLLAAAAAWFASSDRRRPRVGAVVAVLALIGLGTAASMASPPTHWPGVGHAVSRLGDTFSSSPNEASANAEIRTAFWSYALRTTNAQHPLSGVGAGHIIDLNFNGNDVSQAATGVHNSFVGYAFYYGFPCGLLVVSIFAWMLGRAWRRRHSMLFGPALFGAVVAVVATALTNVALESPYIAGPSWLVVAAVVAGVDRETSSARALASSSALPMRSGSEPLSVT